MPIITSRYWNMVHGTAPEEVRQDLEGMQTMRVLGRNMAFFLRCKEGRSDPRSGASHSGAISIYQLHPLKGAFSMENFVYEYPTKVYFGKGAARQHLSNIFVRLWS